jgi:hypothetical protein
VANDNKSSIYSLRYVRDISTTDFEPCPAGEWALGNIMWAKSNLLRGRLFCQTETDYGGHWTYTDAIKE